MKLIAEADAVIENYRPGQLERWGLSAERIREANPRCIVVRISGFGQYGPYRDKISFGVIGEAMGVSAISQPIRKIRSICHRCGPA